MLRGVLATGKYLMSQLRKNPFEVLGLPKTANDEQIKRTYLKLAKQYHPDVNPTYAQKFKQINEAYNLVKDPLKRKQYAVSEEQARQQSYYQQQQQSPFREQDPFRYYQQSQNFRYNPNFSDQYSQHDQFARARYRYYQRMHEQMRSPFQNSANEQDPYDMNQKERRQYRRQMHMQGYSMSSFLSTMIYLSLVMSGVFIIGSIFYFMYRTRQMISQQQYVEYEYAPPAPPPRRRMDRYGEYQ